MPARIPVVVTTVHKGVFSGFTEAAEPADFSAESIVLEEAQMCLYWSEAVQGILGLAVTGPDSGSRVGPPVPSITLRGVTAVMTMTAEAVAAWQARPWSS